jgi:hypothetical protein
MTYNDIYNGLPSLILCCEMVIIAPFFWYAYPAGPYLRRVHSPETGQSGTYQGGPMGIYAILEAMNILDIVKELINATNARTSHEMTSLQTFAQNDQRVGGLR